MYYILDKVLNRTLDYSALKAEFEHMFSFVKERNASLGISIGLDKSHIKPQFIVVSKDPIDKEIVEKFANIA
ncbi:MAG TPA: hypothetical protein PLP33_14710 [Leptospiraceae bacterium]|nr:hypothetical protein [Leptospiraceae bacterium]